MSTPQRGVVPALDAVDLNRRIHRHQLRILDQEVRRGGVSVVDQPNVGLRDPAPNDRILDRHIRRLHAHEAVNIQAAVCRTGGGDRQVAVHDLSTRSPRARPYFPDQADPLTTRSERPILRPTTLRPSSWPAARPRRVPTLSSPWRAPWLAASPTWPSPRELGRRRSATSRRPSAELAGSTRCAPRYGAPPVRPLIICVRRLHLKRPQALPNPKARWIRRLPRRQQRRLRQGGSPGWRKGSSRSQGFTARRSGGMCSVQRRWVAPRRRLRSPTARRLPRQPQRQLSESSSAQFTTPRLGHRRPSRGP